MNTNDRVALRGDQSWVGTVQGPEFGGHVEVSGDGGWSGRIPVGDLVLIEDKSWPPAGLETK